MGIDFGDVIEIDGKELIFLTATLDMVYLAIIPNRDISIRLARERDSVFKDTTRAEVERNKIKWCFIQLSTEEFKDRIALYGLRNHDCAVEDLAQMAKVGTLNRQDKELLQKEVLADDAVTREVQEALLRITLK